MTTLQKIVAEHFRVLDKERRDAGLPNMRRSPRCWRRSGMTKTPARRAMTDGWVRATDGADVTMPEGGRGDKSLELFAAEPH